MRKGHIRVSDTWSSSALFTLGHLCLETRSGWLKWGPLLPLRKYILLQWWTSQGYYLDEWPFLALSQVYACTWPSDCQVPWQVPSSLDQVPSKMWRSWQISLKTRSKAVKISKVYQISIFSERHLHKWHMPVLALSQVIFQTVNRACLSV